MSRPNPEAHDDARPARLLELERRVEARVAAARGAGAP